MRILVTGGNGQLGNCMRDVSRNSANEYIFKDIDDLDLTDPEAVALDVHVNNYDVIVNCAAYTNVDKAEDQEAIAELINAKAVGYLAEAAKREGVALIHISTDYVFQGNGCVPCTEDQPTEPLGVYGRTKLAGEQAVIASGCKYVILRTAWLYSAYGNNFVKTMRRLTAERDELKVVFDQVGTPTYAGDLAAVIYKMIEEGSYLEHPGIYHFSNEGVCSWYDFTIAIRDLFGNTCNVQPCHSNEFPSKVTRPHFSVLDKTKLKQTFGVTVPYWMDALKVCVEQLRVNS
jgi:dTDP-4-dehydrorhamnose reductase